MASYKDPAIDVQTDEAKRGNENDEATDWWTALRCFADVLLLPCIPLLLPHSLFFDCHGLWRSTSSPKSDAVTGTLLWGPSCRDKKVTLCLQEEAAGHLSLILDLPIAPLELSEVGRVGLECDRNWSAVEEACPTGDEPLLAAPRWAVHCNGRRAGFTGPREETAEEAVALESVKAVSTGLGRMSLASSGSDGGDIKFTYMRGRFDKVVGSRDCVTYHLVDPSGSMGLQLSVFFFRT